MSIPWPMIRIDTRSDVLRMTTSGSTPWCSAWQDTHEPIVSLCTTREQRVDGEELRLGVEVPPRRLCLSDERNGALEGFRYECVRDALGFVSQFYRDLAFFLPELKKADRS